MTLHHSARLTIQYMRWKSPVLGALLLFGCGAAPLAAGLQDHSGTEAELVAGSSEEITQTESVTLLVHGMMKSRSGAT